MLALTHYLISARVRSEHGASAVEYGLLITGIAALVALTVFAFGEAVASLFTDTLAALDG